MKMTEVMTTKAMMMKITTAMTTKTITAMTTKIQGGTEV